MEYAEIIAEHQTLLAQVVEGEYQANKKRLYAAMRTRIPSEKNVRVISANGKTLTFYTKKPSK